MKIPLSRRLAACCEFVRPGARVADVGCDHGYLGIHLLKTGTARSVIESDIAPGPLASARRNAEKYGTANRTEFFLSDGVTKIPRDFDTLVCAGMGADTIVSILEAAPWLKDNRYHLILQCQSKRPLLRRYLSDQGWCIREETVLRDGRFLYTVMDVCYAPEVPRLTPGQCYFSPAMLEKSGAETREYYQRTVRNLRMAISARGGTVMPELSAVLQELEDMPIPEL